ncbi:MAG TPA: hypothetical protein PLE12_03575 [Propionicimonas sp.]|nr:hypothetical protein [Propionicimonas sp.]
MTMRHGAVAVSAAMLLALAGCASPQALREVSYNASYPAFASVSELLSTATLVVEGTVLASTVREIDISSKPTGAAADDPRLNPAADQHAPSLMVHAVHTLRIDRAIKGRAVASSTLEVKEPGGTLGDTNYVTAEGVVLRDGQTYVLFLETYEATPASLLNPIQAVYHRSDGKLSAMPGNSLDAQDVAKL